MDSRENYTTEIRYSERVALILQPCDCDDIAYLSTFEYCY